MFQSTTLAVIPARGGSKGIPRKNVIDLCGKPLIAYMIDSALKCKNISDVIVSTEDHEIAEIAMSLGALVPFMRPAKLAEDHVESLPVVQHAVSEMERHVDHAYDNIVLLQPTAPLCRTEDITACLSKLEDGDCSSVVAVTSVSTHPFRMKRLIDGDRLVNYIDQGFEDMRPRQVLPPVYRRAGSIYASRRAVVMEEGTLVGDPCQAVVVPPETAVDIDGLIDLAVVRSILTDSL